MARFVVYGTADDDDIFRSSTDYYDIFGLQGNDTLRVEQSDFAYMDGGAGNDLLSYTGTGESALFGGTGADTLIGGAGDDQYFIDRNDTIVDRGGADRVSVGFGFVTPLGFERVDLVGATARSLVGNDEKNNLFAYGVTHQLGVRIDGLGDNDSILGSIGADTMSGGAGNDTIEGGDGEDVLRGNGGNDYLAGTAEDNRIIGDGDNDTLIGGDGLDYLDGGAGNDTFAHNGFSSVSINLTTQVASFADSPDEMLLSIENAWGGLNEDTLIGTAGANELRGGGGADYMTGGRGADVLVGSGGWDTFIFHTGDSAGGARDTIAADGSSGFARVGGSGGDVIDLTGWDADSTQDGVQDWTFGTSREVGYLWAEEFGGYTLIRGNSGGNQAAELEIAVADGPAVAVDWTALDFVL